MITITMIMIEIQYSGGSKGTPIFTSDRLLKSLDNLLKMLLKFR